MVKRVLKNTIPAKEVDVIVFEAFDGKQFENESSCLAYEGKLVAEAEEVIKTKQFVCAEINPEYEAGYDDSSIEEKHWVYNIKNKHDLEVVIENEFGFIEPITDFNRFGAGLYIRYSFDDGDVYKAYLVNFDNYINEFIGKIDDFAKSVKNLF